MTSTKQYMTEAALQYHMDHNIPLTECIYRYGSPAFFEFFLEAKARYNNGQLVTENEHEIDLLESDIGEFALYEGEYVPLDLPLVEQEERVPLNKPKRGGPKKFYVYVKNPKTGKIKKVTFGDTTGLSVKLNDPKARKAFAARHQCSMQKDKTKAAYWACRVPSFAKSVGLSGGGNFFW